MPPSYAEYSRKKSASLWNIATQLREIAPSPSRLSPFVFMTDPERMPDPIVIARALPEGSAIIYRHFGAGDREATARNLRAITLERKQQLLIGADPELAQAVKADGVHFRRDTALLGPQKWREKEPDWLITMAGLKGGTYKGDLSVLDGLFISSIFASRSPSAGEAIGPDALKGLRKMLPVPIYALGGINIHTAQILIGSGAAGLAAIDGIIREIAVSEVTIEERAGGHRFVIRREGHDEAELTMTKLKDGLYRAGHTGVPKSLGGQGVGKLLVEAMSAHAKNNDYKVIPSCSFVAAMWKRHPDWAEGIAA